MSELARDLDDDIALGYGGSTRADGSGVRTDPFASETHAFLPTLFVFPNRHGNAAINGARHGVADKARHLPVGLLRRRLCAHGGRRTVWPSDLNTSLRQHAWLALLPLTAPVFR